MNKPPIISGKEFHRFLLAYGCEHVSSRGSHFKVRYPKSGKVAPIPVHGNRDIRRDFMRDILMELGIDVDEFLKFTM